MADVFGLNVGRMLFSLAVLGVAAGILFRFWGLGGAPLAVDEYYSGTSVLNLLERGLPEFPCGGYYTRGLLLQYLALIPLYVGVDLELAIRLVPALTSVMTIAGIWLIGRRAGAAAGALSAMLVSLSLWEIEFARFGRMYAPFQALFVWYVYFQMKHLIDNDTRARVIYLGLSAISIFVYAGAALLLALNFLPLIWPAKRWSGPHLFTSALLLTAALAMRLTDFRRFGLPREDLPSSLGADPISADSSVPLPLDVPNVPGSGLIIAVLGTLILGIFLWRHRNRLAISHPSILFWLLSLAALSFGLVAFGLALVLVALLLRAPVPLYGPTHRLAGSTVVYSGAILVLSAVVISIAAFTTPNALEGAKDGLRYLFNYPDVYYKVLLPWLRAIPRTTLWLGLLATPILWMIVKQYTEPSGRLLFVRYLLAVFIILILLVGLLPQPYRLTRYTYFLYPIILVLVSVSIVHIVAKVRSHSHTSAMVLTFLLAAGFLVTEDYGVRHLLNINEDDYRFRLAYGDKLAGHYYQRWDFRGAAEYTNARLALGEHVIVFQQVLPYYLDRVDSFFVRENTSIHSLVWSCGGRRELWSNASLLDREDELYEIVRNSVEPVWLLMHKPSSQRSDPLERSLIDEFDLQSGYLSVDGNLAVYVIEPHRG